MALEAFFLATGQRLGVTSRPWRGADTVATVALVVAAWCGLTHAYRADDACVCVGGLALVYLAPERKPAAQTAAWMLLHLPARNGLLLLLGAVYYFAAPAGPRPAHEALARFLAQYAAWLYACLVCAAG